MHFLYSDTQPFVSTKPFRPEDYNPNNQIRKHLENWFYLRFIQTHTDQIRRRPEDLIDYLGRALHFPDGVVLLSGTGIVPPDDFTLAAGDVVQIQIEGLGNLENSVKVV